MSQTPLPDQRAREYGESPKGRVAHIYDADEDVSLCGVELVRGVTDATAGALCRKCAALDEEGQSRG